MPNDTPKDLSHDLETITETDITQRLDSAQLSSAINADPNRILVVDTKGGLVPFLNFSTDDEDFQPIKEGSQASIYIAQVLFENQDHNQDLRRCALKALSGRGLKYDALGRKIKTTLENAFIEHQEIAKQQDSSVEHNIIHLIGVIENPRDKTIYGILPYSPLSLSALLKTLPELKEIGSDLYPNIILHITSDLLKALDYLHNTIGFIHRDIKPDNIMFYRGHWCLIDLDTATETGKPIKDKIGTPPFASPGTYEDPNNAAKPGNDTFALGTVIKALFEKIDIKELEKKARENIVAYENDQIDIYKQALSTPETNVRLSVDQDSSLLDNLNKLATKMTNADYNKQPSIQSAIVFCEALKDKFLVEEETQELAKIINNFYDAISQENDQFPLSLPDTDSPFSNSLTNSERQSRRISLSSGCETHSETDSATDSQLNNQKNTNANHRNSTLSLNSGNLFTAHEDSDLEDDLKNTTENANPAKINQQTINNQSFFQSAHKETTVNTDNLNESVKIPRNNQV